MKKVLFLFTALFCLSFVVDPVKDTAANGQEEWEAHAKQLYNDGYQKGVSDGRNGSPYVDFHDAAFQRYSSAEYSWYKKGYDDGYNEGKQKSADVQKAKEEEARQNERNAGSNAGYQQAMADFENDETLTDNPSGDSSKSKHWNEGYKSGYQKARDVIQLSEKAKEEGYQQGLKQEEINIPSTYINADLTKKAFEDGFKKGKRNG
ncbi:hypothetical protein ACFSCZ_14885 [Siminovitchia sediminis]|uniref:Uncharacterized protein n=1 Tax=Siminovitchia sediminis TaxID=1274353 RepID=A0ABW4KLE3_9BACI